VLAAGGGVFAVVATEALVEKIRSDNATLAGILLNVALLAVAFLVVLVPVGPPRAAAVVALVVTTPLIWVYAFYGNGQPGDGWLRLIYLLSALMFLGFYSIRWTKGRAIFLALALLFVASYAQFEAHRQFESRLGPISALPVPDAIAGAINPFEPDLSVFSSPDLITRTGDVQAAVGLVFGVVFLGAGVVLQRKRYTGAAVPFLVVGAIEGFAAAAVLGPNEGSVTLGALLAIVVGALLAFGGHGEGRRGSVWIGVIAIVVSLLALIASFTHDTLGRAGYAVIAAAVLIGGSVLLGRALGEPPDGGELEH